MKHSLRRALCTLLVLTLLCGTAACTQPDPESHSAPPADSEPAVQEEAVREPEPEPESSQEEVFWYNEDGNPVEMPDVYYRESLPFPVSATAPSELSGKLRKKYEGQQQVEFLPAMRGVAYDQVFHIDCGFEVPVSTEEEYWALADVFAVFTDAELTHRINTDWYVKLDFEDPDIPEGYERLRISSSAARGRVWGSYRDLATFEKVDLTGKGDYELHEEGYLGWGYLKQYYLALFIDPETGEKLEKPQVSMFMLDTLLDAPESEFYVTPEGHGALRWNEVAGADYYIVAKMREDGGDYTMIYPMAHTEDTEWVHPQKGGLMNTGFRRDGASDDDLLMFELEYGEPQEANSLPWDDYTVIAVNTETHSPVGNLHKGREIANRLVYTKAYTQNMLDAGGEHPSDYVEHVGLIPQQDAVTLASGKTVYRRRAYDYDRARLEPSTIMGPYCLIIPYVIEGTVFEGKVTVMRVDPEQYREWLEQVQQLQEDTAPRGGAPRASFSENGELAEDASPDRLLDSGDIVFASTALGEYLALNMMAGNTLIDLSDFPESGDSAYLFDAWMEAVYQNPLILGAKSAYMVEDRPILAVTYEQPAAAMRSKQQALRAKVKQAAASIIRPGMTDLEKEFAINQYICDTAEYDFAALESAAANNYQQVAPEFEDSFTPYGILINGVGVCAGYAGAFKLLADEAGLESIVVTGYLEGSLPHAWNRVHIDGQWHTIDVTNNDNPYLFNALLNLPDDASNLVLVEDTLFMMDRYLPLYSSNDGSKEYYNVTERRFEKDAVAAKLAEGLRADKYITLRTDYDLDDEQFSEIAGAVLEQLGGESLYGFHWLGVITMYTELPEELQ